MAKKRKLTRDAQGLTPRQREVSKLALARLTNEELAARLELSVDTVRSHWKAACRKVPVKKRRSWRRTTGQPGRWLSRAESELLEAILQSPLVGELARLARMSPRSCRSLLESILHHHSRSDGTRRSNRRRAQTPDEGGPAPPTKRGSGKT